VVEKDTIRAAIDDAVVEGALPHQERLDALRVALLGRVVALYRFAAPALCGLAVLGWLAALAFVRASRTLGLWLLAAGAGLGAATRILLLALVDAVAFPVINHFYMSAAYSLVLLFIPLGLAAGFAAWAGRPRGGEPPFPKRAGPDQDPTAAEIRAP
jgi:hypothetical protein